MAGPFSVATATMLDPNEAALPPFREGDCVQWIVLHSWKKGEGPIGRRGDVGIVVENLPGRPGDERFLPVDGRSVVEFHGSPEARDFVGFGAGSRYWLVDCRRPDYKLPEPSDVVTIAPTAEVVAARLLRIAPR